MNYKETFSKRLIKLREQKNITQQELADELGITRQSLSLYEKSERTINIELLAKIADFFNVSTDYLMGRSDTATMREDIQTACTITGLSEEAILTLENDKNCENQNEGNTTYFYVRNKIISSKWFKNIIDVYCELYENSTFCLNNWCFPCTYVSEFAKKIDVIEHELWVHVKDLALKMDDHKKIYNCEMMCDVNRYEIFKLIEKISDMFDKRNNYINFSKKEILDYLKIDNETLYKMQKKNSNSDKYNTPKE